MARPTTQEQLEKLGFEVTELDGYYARLVYKGQVAAFRGESARDLIDVAKGWVEHVEAG